MVLLVFLITVLKHYCVHTINPLYNFLSVFSMISSGLSAFAIYFVKNGVTNLVVSCLFGAVSTMGFNALDCLGAELFPTHLRYSAFYICPFPPFL